MRFNPIFVLSLVLATGLSGCNTSRENIKWPVPRPLGHDIAVFRPPETPGKRVPPSSVKEPDGEITLRKAIALALLNNPELKAFSWALRAREAGRLQASLRPNPEIGITIENMAGSGAFSGTDEAETTIQLSQVIELGAKRFARTQAATRQRDLTGWEYEIKRMEVFTRVSKAFTAILSAQERLILIEEVLRIGRQVVETVSARVDAGKTSPVEEIKVKVALASIQIKLERAKRALIVSRQHLGATWGNTDPFFKRAKGRLSFVSGIPSQEKLMQSLTQNPELARWSAELSSRQALIVLEKSKAIPDLNISGGLRRLSGPGEDVFVVGLSFPLPLMNQNQGGILEARHELARAEEARRAVEVRINIALTDAYNRLATARAELSALNRNVLPGAQETFDAMSEGYRLGKFSLMDMLDTQRTISDVKSQHLDALTDYHMALFDLEQLIGESIPNKPINADKSMADEKKREDAR
ncbi:MAG: TolC family protein [Nitrospira sp.]|nr:TolC family protein [Candidatus Manganitrophaceae bacterium]HIL35688.1 TolC family protein [Candidatus Manganitrophaceae bacterium]